MYMTVADPQNRNFAPATYLVATPFLEQQAGTDKKGRPEE